MRPVKTVLYKTLAEAEFEAKRADARFVSESPRDSPRAFPTSPPYVARLIWLILVVALGERARADISRLLDPLVIGARMRERLSRMTR
jgi:hypothetical protein